jgi:amidase
MDIVRLRAVDQAAMLRRKEISARELLDAHVSQIEATNPELNAIVTFVPEVAYEMADVADNALRAGGSIPLLTGLPVAHKDLHETKGILTTFGSPVYSSFVPTRNTLIVDRMQKAGAVTVGKTNTPQHGAGSQTFNEVFGVTRNPWNPDYTPGGSSGGAAVAIATGMVSLADGSDYGASLRNPASFTNTVGFRPSPGRIPTWPTTISIEEPGSVFAAPLGADWSGVPIAWSEDLGGLPIDPRVTRALAPARQVLEDIGFVVTEGTPDFSGAEESFKVWRGYSYARQFAEPIRRNPDAYKETIHWNTEYGLGLTAADLGRAAETRTKLRQRVLRFLDEHRFLAIPTSAVPPFPITIEYPTQINGIAMENYTSWFAPCYYISTVELPSISVPAGFTDDGLPVGLQIVGRHHADLDVLKAAYAFQQTTELWKKKPASPFQGGQATSPARS